MPLARFSRRSFSSRLLSSRARRFTGDVTEAVALLRLNRFVQYDLVDLGHRIVGERAGIQALHAGQDFLLARRDAKRDTLASLQSSHFEGQLDAKIQEVQKSGINPLDFASPVDDLHERFCLSLLSSRTVRGPLFSIR